MSYSKKASKTAWSHSHPSQSSSSLTSDLLSGRNKEKVTVSKKAKNTKNDQAEGPRKSKEILRLEKLIDSLVSGLTISPSGGQGGGCFCLAQAHELSPYTPVCMTCGFIMCMLQSPASSCPSCQSPLLSPPARAALIKKLEAKKVEVLEEEERERERRRIELLKKEEARAGGGAFPVLGGAASVAPIAPEPRQASSAKILSIGAGGRKVTVTTISPIPSRRASPAIVAEEKESDIDLDPSLSPVPPPPNDVQHPDRTLLRPDRRWLDLRGEGAFYIHPPPVSKPKGNAPSSGSAKKRKKRMKENERVAEEN